MLKVTEIFALALIFAALMLLIGAAAGLAASFGFTVVAITYSTAGLYLGIHNYVVAPALGEPAWA